VPDPATFRVLPYAPHTGAMLVDQLGLDGEVAPVDQRGFLRRMTDRLAERGARLEVAFENEFALATHDDAGAYVPVDSSLCFSTIGMTTSQDYVDALVDALETQDIPLEQYYAELGHGQQEISTAHRERCARPTSSCSCARRSAASRRSTASSPARAEAVAGGCGQRLPHPLLAVGHGDRAQPLPRPGRGRPPQCRGPRVPRRRARPPARPVRPDRAELQLLRADRAAVLGRRVHVLGPRQP
jgi:hypothetical protein